MAASLGDKETEGRRREASTWPFGLPHIVQLACLGLALLRSAVSSAEAIELERFEAPDGRSIMGVRCLLQDHRGFLWMCSNSGLLRYDGSKIVTYAHDPSDPTSLSGNATDIVFEDRSRDLWVGTWSGLNRLDRETESFTRWRHDPDDPGSLGLSRITAILEDRSGRLWFGGGVWMGGGQSGLDRFDRDTERFDRFRHDPADPGSLGAGAVSALLEDSGGTLWVGTQGSGLHRFDAETESFHHYRHDPGDPHSLGADQVYALHEDTTGRLWVATQGGGLDLFDRRLERFYHYPSGTGPETRQIQFIYSNEKLASQTGTVLLATNGGVVTFDPESRTRQRLPGLEDSVLAMTTDREGTLWIGTLNDGLYRSDPASRQFERWRLDTPNGHNRRANTVREIVQDSSGTLWIGTELGLVRLERSPDAPSVVGEDNLRRYRHDPADPSSLSHDIVWSVHADRSDDVWIGTLGGGINRFDRSRQSFVRYRHQAGDPTSLANDGVYEFYEDRSGTLWVGSGAGLQSFDRQQESFSAPDTRCSTYISWDLQEDRDGGLWIATLGEGLCRRDPHSGELTRYRHDTSDPTSLAHDMVLDIFADSRGQLWFATHGGGLDRFDPQTETFHHINENDGLASNAVYGLLEDASGTLWIQNDYGLSSLDSQGKIHNFGPGDGVLSAQGPYGRAMGLDGELLFGAVDGLNVFRPRSIELNPYAPPVEITDFRIGHRPVPIGSVLEQTIGETDALTLSWSDRIFSFELAALSFRDPQRNRFRYRLDGLDEEWVEVGAEQRFVTYTNLDPGAYLFRVQASNNHGLWNEQGRSIAITVTPPWWATRWFRTFAVLAVAGLLFVFIRQRLQVLEMSHRAEKTEAMGRLASAVAHDFNNLLTVVLGNVALLRKDKTSSPELEEIETAGLSGKALTGQLLAFAREEVVQPRVIDLNEVITETEGLLRRVLDDKVRLHTELADDLWPVRADVGQLQRVLMNLTVNAGDAMPEGGQCTIETANLAKESTGAATVPGVRLRIRDEGVGMDDSIKSRLFEPLFTTKDRGRGTGLGLSTVLTIVEEAGGEIDVESQPGRGTCFEIFLPRCDEAAESRESNRDMDRDVDETLLLVDDEEPTRRVTALLLRRAGYNVHTAADGPEAIRLFGNGSNGISLVLLDSSMPDMDGRAVHDRLAELRPDIGFVFCTGRPQSGFPKGFFDNPRRRLITKPFEEESLLRTVRDLLKP